MQRPVSAIASQQSKGKSEASGMRPINSRLSRAGPPSIQISKAVSFAYWHASREELVLELQEAYLAARDAVAQSKIPSQQIPRVSTRPKISGIPNRYDAVTPRLSFRYVLKVRYKAGGGDHGRVQ